MSPVDVAFREALREEMATRLAAFERAPLSSPELVRAAVACVISPDAEGRACFVLTRRADRPGRHSGQWALPGGRTEPGEDPEDAALRELAEEVGIVASRDNVLGLLDDYETRSGFLMTPVVVWLPETTEFVPNPAEVAAVYHVPLEALLAPSVPLLRNIPESPRPVIAIPLDEPCTLVHAPTAAVLFQLREVLLLGRSTRVSHFEQPVFAWK